MTSRRSDPLTVRILASGSAGNAATLTAGSARILLDAGIAYRDLQIALAHQTSRLDAVLITHEHLDHARGVVDLIRHARVPVFATGPTWTALRRSPAVDRVLRDHPRAAHAITPGQSFTIGSWAVLPFDVQHDAAQPVGYLIAREDAKVVYMVDTPWTRYRFRGLTHVLVEANHDPQLVTDSVRAGRIDASLGRRIRANHASLTRTVDFLRSLDLSTVQEIHLLHLSDAHADAVRFRDTIERETGRPTYVGGHPGGTVTA